MTVIYTLSSSGLRTWVNASRSNEWLSACSVWFSDEGLDCHDLSDLSQGRKLIVRAHRRQSRSLVLITTTSRGVVGIVQSSARMLRADRSNCSWNQLSLDCRTTLSNPILHSKHVGRQTHPDIACWKKRVAVWREVLITKSVWSLCQMLVTQIGSSGYSVFDAWIEVVLRHFSLGGTAALAVNELTPLDLHVGVFLDCTDLWDCFELFLRTTCLCIRTIQNSQRHTNASPLICV